MSLGNNMVHSSRFRLFYEIHSSSFTDEFGKEDLTKLHRSDIHRKDIFIRIHLKKTGTRFDQTASRSTDLNEVNSLFDVNGSNINVFHYT